MARFWFTSAPLPGHLDWGGLLKTAQALVTMGHEVRWVSEARIGGLVTQAGVPFSVIPRSGWLWPPPPMPDPTHFVNENVFTLRYRRALDTWLSEKLVAAGVEAICALAETDGPPDMIVTDPFLSAAALAAEKIGVPLVVGGWASGPPMDEDQMVVAQRQLGREAVERIERLCARFEISGVNFSSGPAPSVQSPRLHISYFNDYWHQGETVLPQTQFVGGVITPPQGDPLAWMTDIPADQPVGMVTLGSTFTGDLDFFVRGAQAIAQADMIPLVVIGTNPITLEQKDHLKTSLPGGTRLLSWVDYDHVLPRLRVILHHGGMGTTHAAILHALPQIIAPHAADQRGQARRARQAKVGLEMSTADIRRGQLIPAVKAITSTEWVRTAIDHLAGDFAALGGAQRAAELLVEEIAGP
ncbi:MAG: glycosyltransferase family 1 protein [Chloroflexi bacterium]|nr:glycosyltransferase family 1 protein [Chloroflexota bacterium]